MAIRPQQQAAIANGLGGAQFFNPSVGGAPPVSPAPGLRAQARGANPMSMAHIATAPPPAATPGTPSTPPPPVVRPGAGQSTPWYGAIPADNRTAPLPAGGSAYTPGTNTGGYNPQPGGRPLYDPTRPVPETLPGGGYAGNPESGTHSVDTTNGPVDVPNNASVGSGGINSQVWNAANLLGLTGNGGTGGSGTPPPAAAPAPEAPAAPAAPPPSTGGGGFGGGLGQAIDKLGLGGSPAPAPVPDPVSNVAAALTPPTPQQPPAAPPPPPPASSGGGGFSGGLGQAIDKLGLGGSPAPTPPVAPSYPPLINANAPWMTPNSVDAIPESYNTLPGSIPTAPPPPPPVISNPAPPPAPVDAPSPYTDTLQQALMPRTPVGLPTQPTGDQMAAIVGGLAPPVPPPVEPPPLYINNPLGMRR